MRDLEEVWLTGAEDEMTSLEGAGGFGPWNQQKETHLCVWEAGAVW